MIDEANKCVAAAEAKDLEALFTAGGDLYLACTACHAKYLVGEPLKN
jgi:cytochrome c556